MHSETELMSVGEQEHSGLQRPTVQTAVSHRGHRVTRRQAVASGQQTGGRL